MKTVLGIGLIGAAIGLFALSQRKTIKGAKPIDGVIDLQQSNPVIIPEQKSDVLNSISMNQTNLNIQTSKPLTGGRVPVKLLSTVARS